MGKKPSKCIPVQRARELFQEWDKKQGECLKKGMQFEDNRDFWWSLDELLEYLLYVKEKSNAQGITNPGIRVYLGASPSEEEGYRKGYSTLFFSPTGAPESSRSKGKLVEKQNNYEIEAFNHGNNGHPPHSY